MSDHRTIDRRRNVLGPDGQLVRNSTFADDPNVRVVAQPLEVSAAHGSFQGAQWSRDRGYVYVPTLDTLKEVDSWSRTELLKRARFIYASGGGLVHRGVDGVARMICGTGLFPYPLGKNKDRNRRLRMLWNARAESANTFDLSRKFSCGMAQQAIVRAKIRDGDVAPVLARNEDGRLRVMFYESHQIGQGSGKDDAQSARWHDGVRLDRHNAPIAYRLVAQDPATDKQETADVPAQNVLFCCNYERFGQVRGLTRFYPVINKVLDRGEIMHALTKGIKMREQIAIALEQQAQNSAVVVPGAPGSGAAGLPAPRPTTVVDVGNGKKMTLEKFFGAGESHELKPGQSYKIVESNHPDANVREHLDNLVRDVAWALKFSPELLWNITQLGGANTRFIMADAQSQIEVEQQELVEQFLGPYFLAWQRDMIEAGEIEDADDWELHTWLLPKRLTVDFGRDGKLHIEQAKRGMITLKSLYGFVGDEWQIEVDQYLDERQYIKEGLLKRKLTWAEGYPEIGSKLAATDPNADPNADPAATAEDISAMRQQLDEIHAALQRGIDRPAHR